MTEQLIWERPKLYAKQEAAVYDPARYAVIEASTKSGKTVGCMTWLVERALEGRKGQHFWWVAPVRSQARIAYQRTRRGLPRRLITTNETLQEITLFNGAVISYLSADHPDTLYGEDVYAAVIDEATRCREEAWFAIRSTLTATGGPLRIIGNVKGRLNWAYRLARRAEAGEEGLAYHRITARDAVEAGIFSAEELEDARRLLPPALYRELYEAEASEVSSWFATERIAVVPTAPPELAKVIRAWDFAATEARQGRDPDWTVGVKMGREVDGTIWILDVERFRAEPSQLLRKLRSVAEADGITVAQHVEQEPGSSGKLVSEFLRRDTLAGLSMFAHSVTGNKKDRALPWASAINGGRVRCIQAPWTYAFLQEHEAFGLDDAENHDDQVDAATLAYAQLYKPQMDFLAVNRMRQCECGQIYSLREPPDGHVNEAKPCPKCGRKPELASAPS